jgi:hypothetical protein
VSVKYRLDYALRRTESLKKAAAILLRAQAIHPNGCHDTFSLACLCGIGLLAWSSHQKMVRYTIVLQTHSRWRSATRPATVVKLQSLAAGFYTESTGRSAGTGRRSHESTRPYVLAPLRRGRPGGPVRAPSLDARYHPGPEGRQCEHAPGEEGRKTDGRGV